MLKLGETPYKCYMCEKRYKDHRGVRAHLKKFHKILNPNTKNLMVRGDNPDTPEFTEIHDISEIHNESQINTIKYENVHDAAEIIEINYEEIC